VIEEELIVIAPTTAAVVYVPVIVTVGLFLYPVPGVSITMLVITPLVISTWAVAPAPEPFDVIVTTGVPVHPVPPLVIAIAETPPPDRTAVPTAWTPPVTFGAPQLQMQLHSYGLHRNEPVIDCLYMIGSWLL